MTNPDSDINHIILVGDNNRVLWQEEKSMLTKSPNTLQTVCPTGMNEICFYVFLWNWHNYMSQCKSHNVHACVLYFGLSSSITCSINSLYWCVPVAHRTHPIVKDWVNIIKCNFEIKKLNTVTKALLNKVRWIVFKSMPQTFLKSRNYNFTRKNVWRNNSFCTILKGNESTQLVI